MAQMLVRAPDELKESVVAEAQRIGISLNALVIQILWDWAKNNSISKE